MKNRQYTKNKQTKQNKTSIPPATLEPKARWLDPLLKFSRHWHPQINLGFLNSNHMSSGQFQVNCIKKWENPVDHWKFITVFFLATVRPARMSLLWCLGVGSWDKLLSSKVATDTGIVKENISDKWEAILFQKQATGGHSTLVVLSILCWLWVLSSSS